MTENFIENSQPCIQNKREEFTSYDITIKIDLYLLEISII